MPKEFRGRFPGSGPIPQEPIASIMGQGPNMPSVFVPRLIMENANHSSSAGISSKFINGEFGTLVFNHKETNVLTNTTPA
jgi:hypothetical protein